MKRIIGPLREMGADIRARDDNFAPLEIRGVRLKAIDYKMPMASAQVKSAVLLAGLFADGVTSVTEGLAIDASGRELWWNGDAPRVAGAIAEGTSDKIELYRILGAVWGIL